MPIGSPMMSVGMNVVITMVRTFGVTVAPPDVIGASVATMAV